MPDFKKLCPGCMREIMENENFGSGENGKNTEKFARRGHNPAGFRCPHCGFSESEYKQNPRCLQLNTILAGKYLVGKVLGEGGFGITYMGYDLNMETRIAIKEYFPVELVSRDTTRLTSPDGNPVSGGGSDRVISLSGEKSKTYQQGLKKYVDEARNVSQFSGIPGIVSVKDFFYENDTAYIVMEYIDGTSLKEYLKQKGGKLSEEEALAVMRPVLEALEKVHAAGIVHRDISPDNIMLTFAEQGNAEQPSASHDVSHTASTPASAVSTAAPAIIYGNISAVKLIDFGAARMTSKNDQKSLTIILKHGYAPEEQYRSHGEQGPWTDVYALCAVFYRMLTGKVPEPAMDRLFSDGLKRPEELGAQVSPAVSEAILKGLAVKKEDRIQSVRDLMDVLYAGKKLKKSGGKKGRSQGKLRTWVIPAAVLAAGCLIVISVAGIGFVRKGGTGTGMESAATGSAVKSDPAGTGAGSSETETPQYQNGTAAGDGAAQNSAPEEEFLTLQESDNLGEQIVFPTPQTSVSGVQQAHTLFLLPDGTVKALGGNAYGQCLVQDWKHVAAVAASNSHSLGLRTDGRVYAAGANENGQCETGSWHDIVAVAAGNQVSFGLRADGTIEACGRVERYMDEISSWSHIRAIAVSETDGGLFGLDESGIMHYAGFSEKMPPISGWEDVRFLCYGRLLGGHLIGLCEDGSVRRVQLGETEAWTSEYEGVENWTDVQQICSNTPVLGVKKDGTVLFQENCYSAMEEGFHEELRTWTDLEAVSSAYIWDRILVFGLKKDGTILEYRQNRGNAQLSDLNNLKWVQAAYSFEDSLMALTVDGRLLSYGLEYQLASIVQEIQSLGIAPDSLKEAVGTEAFLCEDGTLYGTDNLEEEGNLQDRLWTESGVRQAVELWKGSYSSVLTGAYALLTDEGRVKIRQLGETLEGTGISPETWLSQAKEAEVWTDVVQILGINGTIYGLHEDGTLSATEEGVQKTLEGITGVRKIAGYTGGTSKGLDDILALMEDGTVRSLISNAYSVQFGRTQTESWENVADVAVGESHVAGLLADGTVIAAGSNHAGQCDVEDWENIVFLTAGRNCTLGITADGELKMAGSLY